MIYEEAEGGESLSLPSHDILVRHRNPGASSDLIIPFVTECNTGDEQIMANIVANSALDRVWISQAQAHGGIALICGSGPSLADDLAEIARMARAGATIFAMNGAAIFLARHGIAVDYQFIIDARPENVTLIGPAGAHIFASQCDPSLFDEMPAAMLAQVGADEMEFLPEHHADFAVIMGHSSCGNVAPGLAYTMGYRDLHCFGYDSSHRGGEGHPFKQPLNDGEPLMWLTRNGKRYLTSFTMRQQADVFPLVARDLQLLGCAVTVHGYGLLPDLWNAVLSEKQKYELMWSLPQYRATAPGEDEVGIFALIARPCDQDTVLDFGCGTGRAGIMLQRAGLSPVLIDFAENCRDTAALSLPFAQRDLTEPLGMWGDYGFCTDVMEHIPPQDAERVLANLFEATPCIYFRIDTEADQCGALIHQTLHLNVRSHAEWRDTLSRFGEIVYAREHAGFSRFYVRSDNGHA